ncbi:MAG: hypothetical protein ABJL55_10690 [Roseibium sp.]
MKDLLASTAVRQILFGKYCAAVLFTGMVVLMSPAQAEPIALVLDKSEGVSFPAFSELQPGDVINLGNSGHIDLLDYGACREVRITAGIVTVSQDGYALDGSEEKELRAGNCLQAESGTDQTSADKALTVTLRNLKPSNKTAASLMLRFDDQLRDQYGTVFVAFDGGEPKRFEMGENVQTEMPVRDDEGESVNIELFFQDKSEGGQIVSRKFTIDPASVGRKTAVVIVK